MFRFLLNRAALALAVALTISIVTFLLLNVAVDPAAAIAGDDASDERILEIRRQLGFDRALHVQYLSWLRGVLAGSFGYSYFYNQPVFDLVLARAPVTILLALLSVAVTIATAIPLGVAAALQPGGFWDRVSNAVAGFFQATPNFWIGLMLIIIVAVQWRLAPVSGDSTLAHFILPALVLGTGSVPSVLRLTRSGMAEVLQSDYIRTARAKGFGAFKVLRRHAIRNAILPVVSVLAVQLGNKLGGSVITESVFAMNGLGRLALQAIQSADVPLLQMLVFIFALTFVILTFLADLLNAWLDPRIRVG
jgi:peptide/nickel transport system permease protein